MTKKGTIRVLYFSPTHTTRAVARLIGQTLAGELDRPMEETDWTPPGSREKGLECNAEDVLVLGYPVYAGRVPPLLTEPLSRLKGRKTPAVLAAVYGNRAYEDALLEGRDLVTGQGFVPIAAGAFIGEHSYSRLVAAGRPDADDLDAVRAFSRQTAEKLRSGSQVEAAVPGARPYRALKPANPARPQTTDACIRCMACVRACPLGLLHREDPAAADSGCLHCCACVKACPVGAKFFDDERIQQTTRMLESNYCTRREPEWFL